MVSKSIPDLQAGRVYSWEELADAFGCKPSYFSQRGGMLSRPAMGAVLLITHPEGGKQFNYEDYWDDDGCLVYTGQGQVGDQKLTAENRYVAEGTRALLLFRAGHGSRKLEFVDRVTRIGSPWVERALDRKGRWRNVYRFRMRPQNAMMLGGKPKGEQAAQRRSERLPRAFDPANVPTSPKASTTSTNSDEMLTSLEKAVSGHHQILVALHRHLQVSGWSEVEEVPGAIDLWARHPLTGQRVIFEAKTVTDNNEVAQTRAALAQLLEYRYDYGEASDGLCLVVNAPLSSRRIRVLQGLDVGVIWTDGVHLRLAGNGCGQTLRQLVS